MSDIVLLLLNLIRCCFFFFQAEDGIRDYKVTGVQTCALPIYFDIDGKPHHPYCGNCEQSCGRRRRVTGGPDRVAIPVARRDESTAKSPYGNPDAVQQSLAASPSATLRSEPSASCRRPLSERLAPWCSTKQ